MRDFDVLDFADFLQEKEAHYDISDKYNECYGQVKNVHWSNQKDHMVPWFTRQNTLGSGKFTRKVPNRSSRSTYNRLSCSEAILWIAEAVGVDLAVVEEAANKAAETKNIRKRPGIIRSIISWDMIAKCVDLPSIIK